MPRFERWLLLASLWAGTAALAQTNLRAPSAALQCLAAADGGAIGKPTYPDEAFRRGDGGVVKVELVFTAPDAPPEVRLLDPNHFDPLVAAVREHARRLRVPCLPRGGEPARLVQSFVFVPTDGRLVMPAAPLDADQQAQERWLACLLRITPGQRPEYPKPALRSDLQGRFLVRLTFDGPSSPPHLAFVAGPPHDILRRSIEDFVQGYRLPCHGGGPAYLEQLYVFTIEEGERVRLRDVPLVQALRSARELDKPVAFDFGPMGCPFDLQITYYRPHRPNRVRELETSRPERQPLMDWLSRLTLALDEATTVQVLGATFNISVPCGGLRL